MNDFNMYPKGYNMVLGNISTLSKFAKFHDSDKDFIPKVEYNANEFVLNTNRIVAFYDARNCEEIKDMETRYGMRTKIVLDNGEVLYVADKYEYVQQMVGMDGTYSLVGVGYRSRWSEEEEQ